MSVKAWTCSSRVLQIIVFRAEQMYSSACTSRCDELGVGQNRVAARHRQVREASSSSFGVGPSGLSLRDECWSLARRFGDFFAGSGRSQSNGLRLSGFTGLPRRGEPPECGSCRAPAIGVRRLLPHVSRDAGRGRGITQSNRRGTRRGKGYFSPPNQWLALPKSERTCSSPDKKRI